MKTKPEYKPDAMTFPVGAYAITTDYDIRVYVVLDHHEPHEDCKGRLLIQNTRRPHELNLVSTHGAYLFRTYDDAVAALKDRHKLMRKEAVAEAEDILGAARPNPPTPVERSIAHARLRQRAKEERSHR